MNDFNSKHQQKARTIKEISLHSSIIDYIPASLFFNLCLLYARVSEMNITRPLGQVVRRLTRNEAIVGSIPTVGTYYFLISFFNFIRRCSLNQFFY